MFNNKFSRILPHPGYNVGGGIGEAALLGAAFGGAKSLVTGEDLLQGALMGGITGGALGGASSLLGTAGEAAATTTAEGLTNAAADQVANSSLNMATPYAAEVGGANLASALPQATQLTNQGITGLGGMQAIPQAAQVAQETANAGLAGLNAPVGQGGLSVGNVGTVAGNAPTSTMDFLSQPGVDLRQYTTPDTMAGKGLDWWAEQGPAGRAMYSGLGGAVAGSMEPLPLPEEEEKYKSKFAGYNRESFTPYVAPQPQPYYRAQYAEGGITALAQGGMGSNLNFPQGRQDTTQYATPTQLPTSAAVINADYEAATDPYTGSPIKMFGGGYTATASPSMGSKFGSGDGASPSMGGIGLLAQMFKKGMMKNNINNSFQPTQAAPANIYRQSAPVAQQSVRQSAPNYSLNDSRALLRATNPGMADGGIAGYSLGGYADGGNPRLLKGPGDGMSDDIPATIGDKQPARLASGEFVVPADVVSHLGNGSTDAGAKHLYNMMDKVRKARTGSKKQGKQIKPAKYMPA